MKLKFLPLLLAVCTMVSYASSIPVANQSFESPSQQSSSKFTVRPTGAGWTFQSDAGIAANGSTLRFLNAPAGTQEGFLRNSGSIAQSLQGFTIGHTYLLSFYMAGAERAFSDPIGIQIGNINLGIIAPSNTTWTLFTESFVADAAIMNLMFSGQAHSGKHLTGLDDVTLVDQTATVPEPGSLALLGTGLFGIAITFRRRLIS